MTRWIQSTFTSSIGRKALMAVTGLLLVGFLVIHLLGNLTLYSDVEGTAFNAYAKTLHDTGPLLRVAEIGLLVIFLVHIVLGLRVSLQNRDARGERYRRRVSHAGRTVGSGQMSITGIIVGIFLIIHLRDFWWQVESTDELARMVHARLSQALGAIIYIVGVVALWIHLSHGFASAFQTLGLNHPKYNRAIRYTGYGVAAFIGIGFLSFPVYYWLGGNV